MLIYLLLSSIIVSVFTGIILLKKDRNYYNNDSKTEYRLRSAFDVPSLLTLSNNNYQIRFEWTAEGSNLETSFINSFLPNMVNDANDFNKSANNIQEIQMKCRYTSITERMTVVTAG